MSPVFRLRRSLIALALSTVAAMPALAAPPLTIGLIPAEDSQAMIESSRQVLDSLRSNWDMPVKPFVATDYNGVIEALRSKKLDVAYLGPFSYVLANQIADVEAFAVAVTKKTGQSSYKSVIIARKESGLAKTADLKGRTFAFVDPTSASGHLFPKAGLLQAGYDPRPSSAASSSRARTTPASSPWPTRRSMPPPWRTASSRAPSPRAR